MGTICCRADSPCGSAEERSGLLKDESTAKVPTGETVVVGTCGPERDDMSRTHVEAEKKGEHMHHGHENGEIEPNNTQENGRLQKEIIQTTSPDNDRGPEQKEDSTRAQDEDIKEPSGDSGQAEHLQCTLNVQQTLHTAADWEFKTTTEVPKEENPASVQDRIPDGIFLTSGEVWPEKPSHTETTATREHITESASHDNDEEAGSKVTSDNAVAEPSGEYLQKAPNTQLATATCQVSSSSVVCQEISKEAPNTVVTEHSNNGSSAESEQSGNEDLKSRIVPQSPGSEPAGLGQSGEDRDSVNSVREPETTAAADASESLKCSQDAKPDPECAALGLKEVTSLENVKQDAREETALKVHDKDGDVSKASEDDVMKKEEANNTPSEAEIQDGLGQDGKDEQVVGNGDIKAEVVHVMEEEDAEDDLGNSEEDLYRGAEELSTPQSNKPQPSPVSETTLLKVEDRCSLGPAVDILSYSEREWKGNTAKSALIRKGYKEMSQRFSSLRRVRGDNYCALRATLFQVLSHSTQLPAWLQEEDITMLPKQLEAQEGLISQWTFPGQCLQESGTGDATQQLKRYMELLQNTWQAAVDCSSAVERQQLCERVFQGGEEELGLLEALKLLMIGRAVELHGCMQGGGDVPLFCWLLFARDSSDCPRSFLSNHISHVGLSAGLEQVEMFLLGYALQCIIQVYRLYKADTEEFVTYYPDDHKDEWPSVCLVTEDDRHYNVPVVEAAELHKDLNTS